MSIISIKRITPDTIRFQWNLDLLFKYLINPWLENIYFILVRHPLS